ncbi:Spherulation-specific family 4-domain-containing protein [Aspergillus avenaceus]|uniref:Spherulation-specific family 4-domain-containing protein n=1 Tax=Aspergillus avenaceus TaxID=36643 RepID=A0A5N6TZH8_ASPAV|nr:Spherulation-specific family 4-domain-containing protein [Aspergillus avenaceus]
MPDWMQVATKFGIPINKSKDKKRIATDRQKKQQVRSETSPTSVKMPPPSGIIVPFIEAYPNLHFIVIVNPNSGPGGPPDANYAREIARLNSYTNVDTVGYIAVGYCKKTLQDAYEEVKTYATWANDYAQTGLGVGGIFLDETPNNWTPEAAESLMALQRYIKSTPGTPPDAGLGDLQPDLIITCEESYSRYRSTEVQHRLRDYHYDRTRCGYVIHSVPMPEIHSLVHELRHRAAYLFVTELFGEFYERFGPSSWSAFAQALHAP